MRQLLMLAAVAGLALARPETYREKEDFQFSRSSTDEGSKSGYYGAQRGNMGGNYEKAHNMDSLAQNQMSGLVRTVEGELGEGSKQKSGSVFSSANSRGIYGSGNYDLSNLQGRNFQEGETHGSQSHSSLTSHHGSGYTGQYLTSNTGYGSGLTHDSRRDGYSSAGNLEQTSVYNNRHHQASDNLQSVNQYSSTSDRRQLEQSALNSEYYSQAAGYQGQVYDQGRSLTQTSDGYGSDIHTRLVSGKPVRIVIRPGTKVIVPVAAQTYDASQSASSFDQNAINSETEVLNSNSHFAAVTPKTKHYESSYSYRKEWEKHNTQPTSGVVPLAIPTVNPYPANSELYEDVPIVSYRQTGQHRQSASEIASQTQHSSHQSGYNVNAASLSQQEQADYNARLYSSGANTGSRAYQSAYKGGSNSAYGLDTNANNHRLTSGAYIGTNGASSLNQIEDSNTKPKSYQSSYSYHKSWERQGDPYIIQPSSNGLNNGEASGKLTAASLNQGYGNSHQYGTHHQSHQSYSSNADCDEHGHSRVARSPHSHHHHQAQTRGDVDVLGQEDLGQQVQQQWGDVEQFGQQTQTQWDKIEDLGQQTQNTWDQLGQQTETKWDERQQTQQVEWGQQETQKQSDKIEDFGQQSQNQLDQQDVGQQTQIDWNQQDTQQTDLGQQTQETWTTLEKKPIENSASQTEQQTSGFDSSSQQNHGMDHQSNENTFEIAQTSNDQKINTESHTLETNKSSNHHVHNIWNDIKREEIGQENEDTDEDLTQTTDLDHQTHTMWGGINVNENSFKNQETDNTQGLSNIEPISNMFHNMPNPHPWMYNQVHHENRSNSFAHSSSSNSFSESHSHSWQQQHSTSMNSNSFNSNSQSNGSTFGTSIMSLWDKLDSIEKQTIPSKGNDDRYAEQQGTAHVFDTHQVEHSMFDFHNTDKQIDDDVSTNQHDVLVSPATKKPLQATMSSVTTTQPSTVRTNKVLPHDIGRGDIESDETPSEQIKPYKTPEEIETLSLTKETQDNENKKDERNLNVMSLDQQTHSEKKGEDQSGRQSGASMTTNIEQQVHHNHHMTNSFVNKQEDQKNIDQQFANTQQSEGTQQMEQQFETQNIAQVDSFQQEHKKHEAEELGQANEQFDQVSLSGWKPDENFEQQEHKLENWGQETENLEQQSQSGWTENMEDQQVQTGWNPIEDFQQHSQLTDTFEQPMEDLNQQVQPADFEQHSQLTEPLEQSKANLDQQVQTVWKPADFVQHSQLSEPFEPSKENLDQQVQPAWKPAEEQQNSQVPDVFEQVRQNEEIYPAKDNQPEIVEEVIVPKKVNVVNSASEVEPVTEKPGFWKSVGSKFTSAKDKVASWFSN